MNYNDLARIVQNYLDELECMHPFVNSDKFVDNSYAKWACKEILTEIKKAIDLPFDLTPIEILDAFSEKMKRYAYRNIKNSLMFVIASETAEYLIQQCWNEIYRYGNERRRK